MDLFRTTSHLPLLCATLRVGNSTFASRHAVQQTAPTQFVCLVMFVKLFEKFQWKGLGT